MITMRFIVATLLLGVTSFPTRAALVLWDGGGDGTNWHHAPNWVGDAVPTAADDVVIDLPGTNALITIPDGAVTLRSLQCAESFTVLSGSLTLTNGPSQVGGAFSLQRRTVFTVRGSNVVFNAAGAVSADGAALYAQNGATLALHGLSSYTDTWGCCGAPWQASGNGSRLLLPGLTNLVGNPTRGWALDLRAQTGGRIEMTNLVTIPGGDIFGLADGSNSVLDLARLQRLNANILSVEAKAGGAVRIPQLTDGAQLYVTVRTGGAVPTAQLTNLFGVTADGAAMNLSQVIRLTSRGNVTLRNGGTVDLSQVTIADGHSFHSLGGTTLELPALRSYADSSGCCGANWEAVSSGSRLSLPGLTNLTGNPVRGWAMSLSARTGGRIEVPALGDIPGGDISVLADGTNSLVDLSALARVNANLLGLEARLDGSILAPLLVDGGRVMLTVRNTGQITTAQLTRVHSLTVEARSLSLPNLASLSSQGTVTLLNGGALLLPGVTNVDGQSFSVRAGTTLSLPGVRNYVDTSGCCGANWEANGIGAVLRLPALTNLSGNPTWAMETKALAGGLVDLGAVTTIGDKLVSVRSEGSNSMVNLNGLMEFRGTNGYLYLAARTRGTVQVTNLTRLNRGSITIETGGVLPHAQLTNVDGSSFYARAGETISLPAITAYTDIAGCCAATWESSGAGAVIQFPSLTNYSAERYYSEVRALAGGRVDLGAITGISDSYLSILAEGTNSVVDLHRLSSYRGLTRTFWLEARSAGSIQVPALTRLNRGQVTLQSGGQIGLTQVTNIDSSTFVVRAGQQLSLPAVTAVADPQGQFSWEATGAGAIFRLPAVTNVVSLGYYSEARALAGGLVDLGAVTRIPDSYFSVLAEGTNSVVDLQRLPEFVGVTRTLWLEARLGGRILLDALTRLNRATLALRNTGFFPTAQLRSLTDSSVTVDGRTVLLTGLVDMRGTTFSYPNGGSVAFGPISDLAVTDILAPGAAIAGQPVQLVWTVANSGPSTAPGPRHDSVYLSTDTTIGNDTFMGEFEVTGTIAPGASQLVTNVVILPGGLTGNRYFVVQADSRHEVFEGTNEANNLRISTTPVVTSAADLVVDSLIVPSNATFGASATVTWRVRNNGSVAAQAPWGDRVYLSTNNTVSPGAIALGALSLASPPLAAAATYTRTQTIALPLSGALAPGSWFFVVRTDANGVQPESDENNNVRAAAAQFARPPLPDLAIMNVAAPLNAIPGHPISISWTVTNQGAAALSNRWAETLLLSTDATPGNDTPIAFLNFTNVLAPGASLSRTQVVAIAEGGLAGVVRVGVEIDAAQAIVESDESNNVSFAGTTTTIPAVLSLTVSAGQTIENALNPALTARVSRNGSLAAPLTVTFTSSDATELTGPSSVVIPANASFVVFELNAQIDGVVDGPQTVRLVATAPGFVSATNSVTVLDANQPQLHLSVVRGALTEGESTAGILTREGDLSQPLVVSLATAAAGQLSLPGTVTIPAQQTSAEFNLLAVDDYYVESLRSYSITADAPGHGSAFAVVTVADNDLPPLALSLSSPRVSEGAEAGAATLTITREFGTIEPLNVRLTASPANQLLAPDQVTFEPAELVKIVPLSPVDDALNDGNQTVQILVQPLETLSLNPIPPGAATNLVVLDDDGPSLELTFARDWICAGNSNASLHTVTATLTRRGNINAPANALLSANPPGRLTIPGTVAFAANQAMATFAVTALAVPAGRENITLTAAAAGYADATTDLVLDLECGPDLVIANLVAPADGLTDAYFSVNFREQNLGAPFAIVSDPPGITNIAQRVFLSTDAFPGNDSFLGAVVFDGAVSAYTFLDRSATFRLPSVPGNYWVVVQADGSNHVSEISEGNNFTVSAQPVVVHPAYTATVAASPSIALAGTPINLSGVARRFGTSQPAPFEIVSLHLGLRGTTRIIAALTDANGAFSTTFTPLPGEAGTYTVGAAHPGATNVPAQATFTLLGMRATPASVALRMPGLSHTTRTIALANLGDTPLTGLNATVIGAPPEFAVTAEAPAALAPFGQGELTLDLEVTSDTNLSRLFTVRVTSLEGAVADVIVTLTAESLRPRLVVAPQSLVAGVVPGTQRFVEFSVANLGGAASGPMQVLPPTLPWLRVATPLPLPPLGPGESNTVTLRLAPESGTPLGDSTGTILITGGADSSATMPFSFRILSTNSGSLRVEVTDQFTYYADGAPRVTNAVVELYDPATGQRLASRVSDAAGLALFTPLTEAYYTLEVTAAGHAPYRKTLLVGAGAETRQEALLNREVVQFLWNVVPTEIGDRTRITIEATFETVVPVPVVTVEPSVIDLANYPNGGVINLTVTNHGFLAAQQTRLSFSDFDCWKLTPLISDLGTLAARSAMVVPVRICRDSSCSGNFTGCEVGAPSGGGGSNNQMIQQILARVGNGSGNGGGDGSGGGGGGGGGGGNCGGGALVYFVPCGDGGVSGGAPVGVANAGGDCSWHPTGHGGSGSGTLGGGGASFGGGVPCDPCPLELLKAMLKCAIKFIPLPDWAKCAKDVAECGWGLSGDPGWKDAYKCVKSGFTCAKAAGKSIPWLKYLKVFECAYDILTACPGRGPLGGGPAGGGGGGAGEGFAAAGQSPPWAITSPELYPLYVRAERLNEVIKYNEYLFGTNRWFQSEDTNVWATWFEAFDAGTETNSPSAERISATERASLLALPLPAGVTAFDATLFLDRWNRSLDYWQAGIFNQSQVPAGGNPDFIAMDRLQSLAQAARTALLASEAEGFVDLVEGIEAAKFDLQNYLSKPSGGICARVKLKIDQEAVIARDAFRATLEIVNNTGSPLTNVAVDIVVYRPDGAVATELFGISPPALDGLTGVDGAGRVNAASTGAAAWNLLPSVDAAPRVPVAYAVGGSIRYVQDGLAVTVPLALVSITVHPLAQLQLTYFHQRDVLGDDPFTDEIEPSVPYSLAVMVRNTGQGTARNLRITSAQPQIVENQKGLFIDFQIIATEVAGRNLVPSLTASFGDVEPGGIKTGQWLFKSTLQGLFTSYSASFEHLDNLGDPRLSLIQSVEIRELIRVVRATGGFEDGLPDLLVNDLPDLEDLPDTLYLSDGRTQPVSLVTTGAVSGTLSPGNLQITLSSPMPGGWSYLRLPDPANGRYRLAQVRRSDGIELAVGTNVWTTDRTFVGNGRRPVKEDRFHLLDHNSPGSYTLIYEPLTGTDTTPPASRVAALPVVSGEQIPVTWSGEDNADGTGIAYFDLFISTDNGPFLPWLQRTTQTGALFDGVQRRTYAFYSVATDLAGNRESSPLAPDAITGVNFTNTPPTLAGAVLTVDEGTTVRYTNVVVDPDAPPQTLSFSLLGSIPAGATLHPLSGVLTWPTTEASGPGTNIFQVRVSDNGFPSFTATSAVTVVVREVNRAPTLAPIAARTTNEGRLLVINSVATDADLPANLLTFSLATGAPAGATVHPTSGVVSWRPSEVQGGTTNHLTLIVRDNGVPSLSATQQFIVVVRDTQGDFRVGLGTTNLLVGTSNAVPISLTSGIELARIGFGLETDGALLTDLALRDASPEISSQVLLPTGPNRAELSFDFNPAFLQTGARDLAQLAFRAGPGPGSAIAPLRITQIIGQRADGITISNATGLNGRVFVIGRETLLDAARLGNQPVQLTLYGRPGTTNQVESSPVLPGNGWSLFSIEVLTNTFTPLNPINATNAALFWRALTQ